MNQIADVYELSPMQQGMLFHSLYAPEAGIYFNHFRCILEGKLDIPAFQQAWQQVIDRHPILRSSFHWQELDKPLQVVHRGVELPWHQEDWQDRSPLEQQAQLKTFLQTDRSQGMNLNQPPLMRCSLIRLAVQTYQLIWSHHHLLIDGWSLPIVLKEVFAFYNAQTCDNLSAFGIPAPRPYRDYILWLQQQDQSQAEAFWTQHLQGFTTPTPLPIAKPADRPHLSPDYHNQTHHNQTLSLSVETAAALQSLARQQRLTVNTIVQGAWALLLSRYSGESEVMFGATVSGRPADLAGADRMVGLFINTLPMRVAVPVDDNLLPWLQQLMAHQVAQEPYSYSSLKDIQGWSQVSRPHHLFDSVLVFENYPVDASVQELCDHLTIRNVYLDDRTNYPLTVVIMPGEQLTLRLNYDTHAFGSDSIMRMLGHLQTLLTAIATNPHQRLRDLPILTAAERHQLLVAWNQTQVDYPSGRCIHQLIAAQATQFPNAVALVSADRQLTYQQLNQQANQVACYLQRLGIGIGKLVGICCERSIDLIVGLLGILKAGAAYVPFDPSYPTERLIFMLQDAQVSVLLTQQQWVERFDGLEHSVNHSAKILCLDSDWSTIAQASQENPPSAVTVEDLAYVIYTSGSTGQPKGVAVSHRALLNLVYWHQQTFAITAIDRATQLASVAFDACVWELYPYLAAGASINLVEPDTLRSPLALRDWLIAQEITIAFVPTPLAERLLTLDWSGSTLRILLTGGDTLHHYPPASLPLQVVNNYGPTENTVVTTSAIVPTQPSNGQSDHLSASSSTSSSTSLPSSLPAIGRPIVNVQLYVLDRFLQPVPIGVPGELYIGGASLARGYLHQPTLTAERFIANPFANTFPNAADRLYKTGDWVRYRADGQLEFLGRCDHQVKLRGFRIELGEIEAALCRHPAVQAAIVVARDNHSNQKQLIAYVVPATDQTELITKLRQDLYQNLRQTLPSYMLPAAIMLIAAVPLNANGKVDRNALPDPNRESRSLDIPFIPPRDALERQLVQIWETVLEVSPIGVQDNFFDLGGHSLVAVRLMAQIQEQFQKHLPLATLFQAGTVEQLAQLLHQKNATLPWSPLVPIQPNGSRPPFFCVPGAGGNVIYLYALARHLGANQPFYGLQAWGLDGESTPYTRVEDMASHYIAAIQSLQPNGPYHLGGHSYGGLVAFEMAQQLQQQGHEVALLAILDSPAPLPGRSSRMPIDWDNARWLTEIVRLVERLYDTNLALSEEVLRSLNPDEQFEALKERLEQVNLLPPDAGTAQVRGLVEVYKANCQADYVPNQVYPSQISLFRSSEEQVQIPPEEGFAELWQQPAWDWSSLSMQPIEIYAVPGDHISIMTEPQVRVLADKLRQCLEAKPIALNN